MSLLAVTPGSIDHAVRLLPGQSTRPVLTRLALLAAADPRVAEGLLHGSIDAATAQHPHFRLPLDECDLAIIDGIRSHARTFDEFLDSLANIVDGS